MSSRGLPPWRWETLRPGTVTRDRVLLAGKTAVAAGLAWWAAGAADGSVTPYFAPLAVLLVVQPTVYDSLSRAVQRVAGVLVGVLAALVVSRFVGLNGWSIAGIAFVGLLIGWVLRLGPQGVVQVPVSALLVLVVGSATPGYAAARIVDTLIGVTIGAIAVLVSPSAPSSARVVAVAVDPLRRLAGVLRDAGKGIGGSWSRAEAVSWYAEASAVVDFIVERRGHLASQKVSARWNARARQFRPTLDRTEEALASARRMAVQTRGMIHGIVDASDEAPTLPGLGQLLLEVADAVDAYAGWIRSSDDPGSRSELAQALEKTGQALQGSLGRVRERWGDDVDRWLTFGVVLVGTQRILAELEGGLDRGQGDQL